MLNIVMPMAGRGSRFKNAGYTTPKPLIPIHGRPMTEIVIENLRPSGPHRFIFLILAEHSAEFGFDTHLRNWAPNCEIRYVDRVTEGAACTVLLARDLIDTDEPLMIANCDQWVDVSIDEYLNTLETSEADGLIMTMWADHPKWSYVRFDETGRIVEVVEKQVVSNEATVGIYNYRRGKDFVRAADEMIAKNLRVNNEFYVAPAYNELIAEGQNLVVHNVGKEDDGMYGLGVPVDLDRFIANPISEKAVLMGREMNS
ncbi:MAG: glycosyltransferase family 2 protein [Gemmataceae bacterium]